MKRAVTGFAIAVLLGCASAAHADTYVVGSLDGQNGWNGGAGGFTNNDPGDEAVTTAAAHTGTQAWRYSAGYNSPGSGTPFSPQLAASAGLTGSGATADTFSTSFWFKPVGALGDGSKQNVYEGTTPRDDRTGSNIYLENTGAGIVLSTFQYGGGAFPSTTLITLNDTDWHHVEMITTSTGNNASNETTSFKVDGNLVGTTIPWGDEYRADNAFPFPSASSLKFATSQAGPSSAIGYYYDDVSYSVYDSSAPNTVLASYSTSFEAAVVPTPKTVWAGLSLFACLGLARFWTGRRKVEIA